MLIYIYIFLPLLLNSQVYEWAKKAFTTGPQHYPNIRCDNSGNVLVAGTNIASATYGNITVWQGGFVVKYTSAGKFLWGKNVPGTSSNTWSCGLGTDQNDNVYVATNLNNYVQVSKYDSSGALLWNKSFGQQTEALSMCISKSGTIYLTGDFSTTSTSFDNFTVTDTAAYSPYAHLFVAAINSAGSTIWLRRGPIDSFAYTQGRVIFVHKSTLYMAGLMSVCNHYNCDGSFLSTLDTLGNFLAIKCPTVGKEITGIAVDNAGNIYCSTDYYDQYGGATYIEKTDQNLNKIWTTKLGESPANNYCFQYNLVCDSSGNTFISGNMGHWWVNSNDSVFFDSTWVKLHGRNDIATLSLDSSGKIKWVRPLGGDGEELNGDICMDANANCYLVCQFNADHNGDTIICVNDTLVNDGNWNQLFVTKLGGQGSTLSDFTNTTSLIEVYPNPASEKIFVRHPTFLSWVIRNNVGQIIGSSTSLPGKTEIDLSAYTKGVYLLELNTNKGRAVRKIILE